MVIITGGGRGIGASITRTFHAAGCHVVIASRSDTGLARELGERVMFRETDVRQPAQLSSLIEAAVEWGQVPLSVMVNNAGFSEWRRLDQVDESFWDGMVDTNLKGMFFGCQFSARHLGDGGSIINVSSLAGKRGSANNSVYCASKFGVNGVTQALAKELGPRGIRVNAVCPVYVQTEGLLEALADEVAPTAGAEVQSYLRDFAAANSALGRLPTAEQVAQTCLFLASDAAAAITGQCLNVDCGVLPQ